MSAGKHDAVAAALWSRDLYDKIPKAVFAVIAWHFAARISGEPDTEGSAERAFAEELKILRDGGHLDEAQADRALKAFRGFLK